VSSGKETMNDAEMCVYINYSNLHQFIQAFQTSVALFELLERGGGPPSTGVFGGVFIQYRIVAARDGALNIYHFGSSLAAIRTLIATHRRELADKFDPIKIRKASTQFRADFPHIDSVRHAIAHAGELNDTPSKLKTSEQKTDHTGHGFSSGAGGILVNALYERTYSIGFEGSVFTLQLDAASISKLEHIFGLVGEAFSGSGQA
jgi:hypothetical protein